MKKNRTFLCVIVMTGLLLNTRTVEGDRSSCHSITVDVRSPIDNITINGHTGIADEEQVEIRCDCLGPKRQTSEWSYNDKSLPSSPRDDEDPYVESDGRRQILRVDSFEEDSSGLYTCHSRDVTVEFNLVWYDPNDRPEFVVEPKRQNIKLKKGDEKVTLECIAFNALIRWERRSGELPSKAILREGNSTLEIPNPRSEDNGDYRCVAENSFGTSMSKYVKVSIKGELKIMKDPLDTTPRIGTSVTLTCSSEGFQSENFIYLWTNSSNNLVYSEASPSGNSSLVFPVVRPSDSGEYRCIVQNEWGEQVISKPAALQVMTPNETSFPSINNSRGTINDFSVTLNWEISSINKDLLDSIKILTEWISLLAYSNGTSSGKRQITGNTDTVIITDLATTQYTFADLQPFSHYCFTVTALYAFEGQALGERVAEPFCTNTSKAVPSAPQNVAVLSQGFTSLTLTWSTPQSPNGIILNYTIKYNDKTEVVAVEDVNPVFILSRLVMGTAYDISVSATNGAGEGSYSNIITTNTLNKTPGNGRSPGQLLFQIKFELEDIQFCPTWISDNHRWSIVSAISDLIKMECNCNLEEGAIDQDHLLCDQSQLNRIVFRAEIITYQLTRGDLLIILQNMITAGRLMLNESTVIRIDNNCPVQIMSFNDPLCAVPMNDNVEGEEQSSRSTPTGAIIGSISALIILILLIIMVLLLILYCRTKYRKDTAKNELGEVRHNNASTIQATMPYSTPLPVTVTPVQKECQVGKDGYLIPNRTKMENTDFPIPYVDFDDDIYLKSILNSKTCRQEEVKMQKNPSYFGATIPYNSTEV